MIRAMSIYHRLSSFVLMFALGGLVLAGPARAEAPPQGLTTQKIFEGLYLLQGAGGNIVLQVGPDGVLLVDAQAATLTSQLKTEIAKVTDKPVRFLINTHWHRDHTGGNETLGAAGAVILAHESVRMRLSTPQFIEMFQRSIPPVQPSGWPVLTFTESVNLHLPTDDIDIFHLEPAHTDGDSVVWFRRADVVHMGDLFVFPGYPFIDHSSGGAIHGFVSMIDRVLAGAKDTTKIVPGHGPISTRAQLKTWRDMLVTIRDRIKQAVAAGKSLAEIQASRPTAEFDAAKSKGYMKPAQLVETIYQDLTKPAPKR